MSVGIISLYDYNKGWEFYTASQCSGWLFVTFLKFFIKFKEHDPFGSRSLQICTFNDSHCANYPHEINAKAFIDTTFVDRIYFMWIVRTLQTVTCKV
jgi:hypothetical protein